MTWLFDGYGAEPLDLHTLRLRANDQVTGLRAVTLTRLLPVPDGSEVSVKLLLKVRKKFGDEMRAFRRFVERALLELAAETDPARQIRKIDLMGEEFEDEIRRTENFLRRAGVEKVTRSTLIQLARHADMTGTTDRIAKAAEDVIGGDKRDIGPLAYAAIARMEVFGRRTPPGAVEFESAGLVDSLDMRPRRALGA